MLWGVLWLVATLGGPIAVLVLTQHYENAALWTGVTALVLHPVASRRIVRIDAGFGGRPDSHQLSMCLLFGGWALMLCVFFAGCVAAFEAGL